jgi:enamine deaminase RidA (YjgF/YER057c/UK114 family)
LKPLAPEGVHAPFGRYSHGVAVPAGRRLVVTSGQLGIRPDGTIPDDAGEQAAICLAAIAAILDAAGAVPADIVRLNAFVTDRAHMPAYMAARDAFLAGVEPPPASTLVIVSGFTRPEFKVEIEAIACPPVSRRRTEAVGDDESDGVSDGRVVPVKGLEPPTPSLRMTCSTS